jgi:hypothetical protein
MTFEMANYSEKIEDASERLKYTTTTLIRLLLMTQLPTMSLPQINASIDRVDTTLLTLLKNAKKPTCV